MVIQIVKESNKSRNDKETTKARVTTPSLRLYDFRLADAPAWGEWEWERERLRVGCHDSGDKQLARSKQQTVHVGMTAALVDRPRIQARLRQAES